MLIYFETVFFELDHAINSTGWQQVMTWYGEDGADPWKKAHSTPGFGIFGKISSQIKLIVQWFTSDLDPVTGHRVER